MTCQPQVIPILSNTNSFWFQIHPQIVKYLEPDSELAMKSTTQMAELYWLSDMLQDTERLVRELLQITLNKYGINHAYTVEQMINLAGTAMLDDQDMQSAERFLLTAIQVNRRVFKGQGPDSTLGYRELSNLYHRPGKYEEGIRVAEALVRMQCDKPHINWRTTYQNLFSGIGIGSQMVGDYRRAESVLRMCILWDIKMGRLIFWRARRLQRLADTQVGLKYTEEAARRYEECYGFWSKQENGEKYEKEDPIFYKSKIREALRKSYSCQGLYPDADAFKTRLEHLAENRDITTFHLERERKWCRFEDDEYISDVDYHQTSKRRRASCTREDA
jgi:tetratricopeptide (TPR) repeat protein